MVNIGKESELVEFKKSTGELNEGIISIVSMLNKHGKGTLYFGVKNNGDAIGQMISDNTLRDISRKIYEDINPKIYPSIHEIANMPGVIEINFIGQDKPYSAQGKFYIRTSDEDRKIDVHELLKIINRTDTSNALWEKMESDETIDDVDEELLKSYIAKANKSGRISEEYTNSKTVLKKLGLLVGDKLNNAGKILFSKNKPIVLKLAVFASDEMLSFIDINRYEGNLFELNKKAQEYILEHINFSAEIVRGKRLEKPEIPYEVIREAVLNSLCHSSFDVTVNNEIYITPTKVVIFNPGTFPSGYNPEDFAYNGVESVLRNPLISRTLYYSNDIDSWATGFRRIFSYCKKDDIKFTYTMKNQGFEICFYRKKQENSDLEKLIIDIIKNNPTITISKISDVTGKSTKTIQSKLNSLKEQEKIKRVGSNKNGHWQIID